MTGQLVHLNSSNSYIKIETSNAANECGIHLKSPNGGNDSYFYRAGSADALYVYHNGAERWRLDASGRVTTPYQPAFHVNGTSYSQTNNGSSKIIPDSEAFDVGGHYDRAAGRFTAPVAGVYLFGFFGLSYPHYNGDVSSMQYYKNGSAFTQNVQFGGNSSVHTGISGSVQMNLSAGDYVELFMYGANGAKAYGSQWNMWGRLCG